MSYKKHRKMMGRGKGKMICWSYQEANRIYQPSISTHFSHFSSSIQGYITSFCALNSPESILFPSLLFYYLIYFNRYINYHMAQGKSKKSYGKKGQKKKVVDSLSRKEWFELKAPAPFQSESFGFTCANRTQGLKKVQDSIKGRVVSSMQADLAPNQDSFHWRKIKLIVDQTEGRQAITSFYGVDITRDELSSLIKKRKTLIEAIQDVKSQDGYVLRVFVIAFTRESPNQKRKTNYALSSQQKLIRKRINDIVAKEIAKSNATQILNLFTSEVIEKKITKEISPIYPVKNVKVRKIKVIQRPNVDFNKLSEMHDPEKRILTKASEKVQGRRGKPTREANVEAENLVNK